jgi:peptidoglycan hydrolase CwlO-like protein
LKDEIKSLEFDAEKFEQVRESKDKEIQKCKLDIARVESVIEDLRTTNDELLSVINVKSSFI